MPRSRSAAHRSPLALDTPLQIEATNQFRARRIDVKRLCKGVQAVLNGENVKQADISLAIVDDRTIAELNQRYLGHKGPTDVISFALEDASDSIDGEIVASAETAKAKAKEFGWAMADELLLYVVHGALHLVGYDDISANERAEMRRRERFYLSQMGIELPLIPPEKTNSRTRPTAPRRKSRPKSKVRQ